MNNRLTNLQPKTKIKVLNKHFAAIWYGAGAPRIEPNPFEMAKQYCLLDAKDIKVDRPYFSYSPDYRLQDDFPDLFAWHDALTYQNPASKVNFRLNPDRFRQMVEPLDFSKPYDQKAVDAIHAEFSGGNTKRAVDPAEIIEAELFE